MLVAWPLLLAALSLSVGNLVVSDRFRSLWWKMDTKLGGSQLRAEPVGRLSRAPNVTLSDFFPVKSDKKKGNTSRNASPVTSRRSRNTSPAISRRSNVVSWSDSPRDQAVSKSVKEVMEDCTESFQIWNDTLGEQSRNQVGTTVPAAMGPCAPSEPVLHSSGFVVTSEHAVTSGCFETRVDCAASHGFDTSPAHLAWSQPLVGTQTAQVGDLGVEPMTVISGFRAEPSAVVQGKSCVERVVSHGFDIGRSGGSCGKDTSPAHLARSQAGVGTQHAHVGYPGVDFSMARKPVFLSSGLAVTNEHAVEVVVPGFLAESSAVVQGKSCADRAVSHGFDVALSGGTCGKDTSPAHLARSQPDVSTQCALVGYPRVELVSRATYISRKKRNLETVQRQSKALKRAQRDAKRKFVAQPEISHEAAELILRNQAARTDEKFPGTIHGSHHLASLHGHENVFFCTQCGAVNAGGALRLLKSQCDGSGESYTVNVISHQKTFYFVTDELQLRNKYDYVVGFWDRRITSYVILGRPLRLRGATDRN